MYSSRRNMSILNHAAVEALCSATYVENYLDCTQNLSDEVQRMLSKVFELDFKTMEINTEMKRHEKSYNRACSRLDHAQHDIATKKRLLIQIQRSLIRNQEIADEKLRLVNHICEIIDNTTRQLDQDRENLDPAAQEKPVTPLNNSSVARVAAHASKASAAAQMAQDRLKHQNTDKFIKSDNRHSKSEKSKTLKVNREKVTNTAITVPHVTEIKKSTPQPEIKSEIKVEEKQEVLCLPLDKSPIASKDHIKHVERGGGDHIVRPEKEEIIEKNTEIEKPVKSDDHIKEIIKSPPEQASKQIKNEPQRKEEKHDDTDISPVKSNEVNEKEDEEMDNSIDNIPIEKGKRLRRQRHPTSESTTNIKDIDIRKEEMEEPRKKKKKKRKDLKLNTSKSPVQNKSKQVSPIQETDPDEVTYCSCKQISYGDMIGCDYINCSIEWYHFNCVGLDTKPKGKWYCPACRKGDKSNICRSDLKV